MRIRELNGVTVSVHIVFQNFYSVIKSYVVRPLFGEFSILIFVREQSDTKGIKEILAKNPELDIQVRRYVRILSLDDAWTKKRLYVYTDILPVWHHIQGSEIIRWILKCRIIAVLLHTKPTVLLDFHGNMLTPCRLLNQ
jgi:hypothetical protein